jgi:excisionase family DNA binding protein
MENSQKQEDQDVEDDFGEDRVLDTNEACRYLKISKPTLLKYIREGLVPAGKVGKGWRILKSDLDIFIRSGGKERNVLEFYPQKKE